MRAVLALAVLRPLGCLLPFGVLRSAFVVASRLSPSLLGRGFRPSFFVAKICTPAKRLYPIRLAYVVDF